MDIKPAQEKMTCFLKKYRYVILVVVIGLLLMAIPSRSTQKESVSNVETSTAISKNTSTEEEIENILSLVSGAGNVRVFLTTQEGEETIFQVNEDTNDKGEILTNRTDTVTVTDAQRNQTGLVRQVNPAKYKGAIVVCQGADDPAVRLAIVDAISKVTGLGTNRISVLKMK